MASKSQAKNADLSARNERTKTALEAYCTRYNIPIEEVPLYENETRQTFFAFLLYPDSAPENWVEMLGDTHIRTYVSPLHDLDRMPDGTQKKPHWHVLLQFDSLKSVAQFEEIRDRVGGVGREEVSSGRGYARYLLHLDNPEKAQYRDRRDELLELSGADWDELTRRLADGVKEVSAMKRYIRDNDIRWYDEFDDYCNDHNPVWAELLATRFTYTIYTYIKARAKHAEADGRAFEKRSYVVNPETGEVEQ